MTRLQDVGAKQRGVGRHPPPDLLLFGIAWEKHRERAAGQPHAERAVVDGIASGSAAERVAGTGRGEDPEGDRVTVRDESDRAHSCVGHHHRDLPGSDGLKQRDVVLRVARCAAVDETAYRNLCDHPGHAAVVVGVGVRQDDGGERVDAELPQVREHGGAVIAGVEQDMPRPAPDRVGDEDGVAADAGVAHVQHPDQEDGRVAGRREQPRAEEQGPHAPSR